MSLKTILNHNRVHFDKILSPPYNFYQIFPPTICPTSFSFSFSQNKKKMKVKTTNEQKPLHKTTRKFKAPWGWPYRLITNKILFSVFQDVSFKSFFDVIIIRLLMSDSFFSVNTLISMAYLYLNFVQNVSILNIVYVPLYVLILKT